MSPMISMVLSESVCLSEPTTVAIKTRDNSLAKSISHNTFLELRNNLKCIPLNKRMLVSQKKMKSFVTVRIISSRRHLLML